jgi:hypothetical protein
LLLHSKRHTSNGKNILFVIVFGIIFGISLGTPLLCSLVLVPLLVSDMPLFFPAALPFCGQESPFLFAADVDCNWDREDTECP